MQVYLSPQVNPTSIEYSFEGDIINVTINGITDEFDFTSFPNGKIEDITTIETTLEFMPIISAERIEGILKVELLNCIGEVATYEECFPTWKEV